MKKNKLLWIAATAVAVLLLIVGISSATVSAAEVKVTDPNLKKALQEILGVQTITTDRLDDLEELDLSGRNIASLTGLEKAINLRVLSLRDNQVRDLTPLSGLTRMQSLDLCGNEVAVLTPLSKLSDLRILQLTGNRVEDLAPVASLKRLQFLFCENNALDLADGSEDLSVIRAMEKRGVYIVTAEPVKPEFSVGADQLSMAEGAALSRTENNILLGAARGTTVGQLTAQLVYTNRTLVVKYSDGTEAEATDFVATGMTVQMVSASGTVLDTCVVAVYGDTNGDGRISVTDYLQIRKHLLGIEVLQDVYLYGGDHNGDGQLTITDALQTKAYILNVA